MSTREYVYIIKNLDIPRIKIGVSNDIERRIVTLQNAGGCRMELSWHSELLNNAYFIEGMLHNEFKEFRYIGEWFHIGAEYAIPVAIKFVEENGQIPKERPACVEREIIPEPMIEVQQPKENIGINVVKDLNLNKYQRIKPGIYMDGDGKLFSIKYHVDGGGWNVSELEKI